MLKPVLIWFRVSWQSHSSCGSGAFPYNGIDRIRKVPTHTTFQFQPRPPSAERQNTCNPFNADILALLQSLNPQPYINANTNVCVRMREECLRVSGAKGSRDCSPPHESQDGGFKSPSSWVPELLQGQPVASDLPPPSQPGFRL